MSSDIEERKKEFKEKLINDLFIERYDTFKESITLINMALENFKMNYQYTYDGFCNDYINECMEYMDKYPTLDMMNPRQISLLTLPLILSIINKIKNKYGFKND